VESRPQSPIALGSKRAPGMDEVAGWVGWRVDDVHGSMIGTLERVHQDVQGRPVWLIVSEFRPGDGRTFAIPAADAVGGSGRVWSPHPRERICATAGMVAAPFTAQADSLLLAHYAGGAGAGRAA
jgi:hypothetical protein